MTSQFLGYDCWAYFAIDENASPVFRPDAQSSRQAGADRIGYAREHVSRARAPIAGVVTPKIALGRRSTSSFANVLIVSASAALQRSSIRRLLPSVHPNFASAVRTPRAKTARLNRSPHRPHADQPHRAGGLRARRERPCDCRTAEKRDELALSHSITSSARARSVGGMSRFSERAVWRLMTNSNLVDCRTGRSAGLAPLSMLPV